MYLSQLMSTFLNYLEVHCPFEWSPISESQKPEIQQSHMYSLIHWFTHPRIHRGDHFLVILCTLPTFDPEDLIGRTFLLPPEENGERPRLPEKL